MNRDLDPPRNFNEVIEDVIRATANMTAVEYRDFMELPVEERIRTVKAILEKGSIKGRESTG